jgi:hypothetical protein
MGLASMLYLMFIMQKTTKKFSVMRRITQIVFLLSFALLVSCRGEQGRPGEDGLDGTSLLGSVFEIEGDFLPENDFRLSFEFPTTVEVYESDIVLVYILWEQAEGNNGQMMDVWRMLPQTVILDEGILQYNFDHTVADVQIFLEGTINFDDLLPAEALGQVFRIVLLPADFALNHNLDVYDYNLMMKSLQIRPDDIIKLSPDTNTLNN